MKKIREIIQGNIGGRQVLVFFLLAMVFYGAMLFITVPATMAFSDGLQLLDMRPGGYTPADVEVLFGTLGVKGRDVYLLKQLPLNLVYPFLFGVCFTLVMAYFLNKLQQLHTSLFLLCYLPLAAAAADYLENIGIITLLNTYPNLSVPVIRATSFFTVVKSGLVLVFFIALFITMLIWGVQRLRKI
ncbi:MAG: hypothetical protein DA408_17330 [Bacteroidetes bacterium]|nr:MAG: hypothetical protein C7N36_03135 [Bacteroidota bacterium]PTM09870.1 MAG: hypothetical protein DA408_17330 [Bacteroidota bacterium]